MKPIMSLVECHFLVGYVCPAKKVRGSSSSLGLRLDNRNLTGLTYHL